MGDILVIEMNNIKFLSKGNVYYYSEEKEDGGCGCGSFVIMLTGHELNTGFTCVSFLIPHKSYVMVYACNP